MLLLLSVTSCHWFEPEEKHIYDRTVLVYIAAENTLSSWYREDIDEMKQAVGDIPANSKLIIYLDDTQLPRIISIEKSSEGDPVQKVLYQHSSEQDSGDPETLHRTMDWVTENYPAHSYGLVLWSHGDAWLPANTTGKSQAPMQRSICIDNNLNTGYRDEGSKMDIAEVAEVLSTFPRLEFILFDACFMQAVEVAYDLRHAAKAIVASPAEIPGPGAPYQHIIKPMFASPFDANKIAGKYFQAYNDADRESALQNYGVLLSVVDCDLLDDFAAMTAEMIMKYVSKDSALTLDNVQRYCPKPNKSRPSYYDMNGYMLNLITDKTDYTRWKSLLDRTVCYAAATPWWYSIYSSKGRENVDMETYGGISCYVPQNSSLHTDLNTLFRSTSWYTAAGWQQVGW